MGIILACLSMLFIDSICIIKVEKINLVDNKYIFLSLLSVNFYCADYKKKIEETKIVSKDYQNGLHLSINKF